MPGTFVVFEGIEGAGKTTQLRLLVRRLEETGMDVVPVREPGGTPVGDAIRALLLDAGRTPAAAAEALLFMASRAQLVDQVIAPALLRGALVIADRFFLSTYAYQVAGRGLPEAEVRSANALATRGLVPDLTLLLDLPADEGLRRAGERGEHDRMERSGREFHERVRSAFRDFSERSWQEQHPECGPIVLIDASAGEVEVAARVLECLSARWPGTFADLAGLQS